MYKFHTTNESKIIAYKFYESKKKTNITVVFLHGLMSNSESSKAVGLYDYCKYADINFIAFDNFGHGKSSGKFIEQTMSDWRMGLELVISHIVQDNVILIGSSAGAWTALLESISNKRVKGLICIASAPDFTEMIRDSLSLEQIKFMQKNKWLEIKKSEGYDSLPISYKLIEDGKKHLLLTQEKIDINCLVHLIHGVKDKDVPYSISSKLFKKISSDQTVLKLIKDGDHSLSEPSYMHTITNSLDEMLKVILL